MGSRCAWCQIDTKKQLRFFANEKDNGNCPICGCYNDAGQWSISINSMQDIYMGALRLMNSMAEEFGLILERLGITQEDLMDALELEDGAVPGIRVYTSLIVRELFLSQTNNSGSTSVGNLAMRLGIKYSSEVFPLLEDGDGGEDV